MTWTTSTKTQQQNSRTIKLSTNCVRKKTRRLGEWDARKWEAGCDVEFGAKWHNWSTLFPSSLFDPLTHSLTLRTLYVILFWGDREGHGHGRSVDVRLFVTWHFFSCLVFFSSFCYTHLLSYHRCFFFSSFTTPAMSPPGFSQICAGQPTNRLWL